MQSQLSEKKAKLYVIIIAVFHLVSGVWEFLMGLTQGESISLETYFFLDIYRSYLGIIGLITILLGILLFFRLNMIRLIVIALAWWNLFMSPLLMIWWDIYAILIKGFLVTDSWFGLWIETLVITVVLTIVRLYIINMLKLSKAGYIFLRKKPEVKVG